MRELARRFGVELYQLRLTPVNGCHMPDTITIDDFVPRVLPVSWVPEEVGPEHPAETRAYRNGRLYLLVSLEERGPTVGTWLHASLSHRERLPLWRELVEVKTTFFGDRPVVQVIPPEKYYINLHPRCLHLFERLDADTVPPGLWEAG